VSRSKTDNTATFDAAPLSDEVLEAASSKGLLRRARRDMEAGLVRLAGWDGGTAIAETDGETVRLPGGPITAASCTCPANGLCRHILASILFARDAAEPTAPLAEDAPDAETPEPVAAEIEIPTDVRAEILALDEEAFLRAFGRAAHVRARALLAALEPEAIRIESVQNALRITLGGHPAVFFPAGGGPAGMISKAAATEQAALHAAALLAVRGPAMPAADEENAAGDAEEFASDTLGETAVLLRAAARQGLSKAPAGLEERLGDLAISSRAEAIPRLAAELRMIAAMIRRRRERLDAAEPAELLVALARTYALTEALQRRPEDSLLSGSGGETPQPLPGLELIGCGLRLWRSESGARGVTGYYLSPDGRSFNATLARGATTDPGFAPQQAATAEPVFGRSLAALAGTGFSLEGAFATAEGRLQTGNGRAELRQSGWSAPLSAAPGLVIDDWHQCMARLSATFRPLLAAPARRAMPLVLRPVRFGPLRFDGVAQAGRWPIGDRNGAWLELEIESDERLDSKFELLGALDERQPPLLAILAESRGANIVLSPLGFGKDSFTTLDLPPPVLKQPDQRESLLSRLTRGLASTATAGPRRSDQFRFEALARPQAASMTLISAAFDEILALAELGGRMEDPERLQHIEQLGRLLDEAGLALPANLLAALSAASSKIRADRLLRAAYGLDLLKGIEPQLPFVRTLP
jgi:hypothetical protein